MVEGIIFGICNLKIGVVTQRAGRLPVGRYFREHVLTFKFYAYPFIVNVVHGILPFLKLFVCNFTQLFM